MKRYESSEEAYQAKADACNKRFAFLKNKKGKWHRAKHYARKDQKYLLRLNGYTFASLVYGDEKRTRHIIRCVKLHRRFERKLYDSRYKLVDGLQ